MPCQSEIGLTEVTRENTLVSIALLLVGDGVGAQLLGELESLATERAKPRSLVRVGCLVPRQLRFAVGAILAGGAPKGRVQNKKNVSIRALPELANPPLHPPIRATFPTFSAVATVDETFSLSKKSAQKNSGKGKPPPQIRAMPELKRFFCSDVVPNRL